MSIRAYDFSIGGIFYNITSSITPNTLEVTHLPSPYISLSYTGTVIIPSTVTYFNITYSVTSIGSSAFNQCTSLTSIQIPNSVTSIGADAFQGCTGLTSIIIPSSVKSISAGAFYACNGLTSVTIPSSVTSIGSYAFGNLKGLINVDAANSNYSSLNGVLYNKTQTQIIQCSTSKTGSFIIPSSVTSIGDYAFYECTGLTSISIPSSVTSIGSSAFAECYSLGTLAIPSSVTSIGSRAFTSCKAITSITIPSSVTSIGDYTFSDCTGLTSITVPSSISSIGDCTFYGCSALTSITIPSSITSIGSSVFWGCTNLSSISIPSSVTSIGSSAFQGCTGLTSIYAYPSTPIDLTSTTLVFQSVKSTCILYVPHSSISLYQSAIQWKDFTSINAIPIAPELTTTAINNITETTANSGGNITYSATTVTARGVCWSTTANPTISNSKTSDGTGTGIFTSSLTGLTQGPTYHIRAYATNSIGTSYGSDLSFTTSTLTTTTTIASSITGTTAISGGKISSNGGAAVTARGVCWSTTANPTIANSKTSDGIGTGSFVSSITGLLPNTTYHVRAYVTNSIGTAYGSDVSFTTLSTPTLFIWIPWDITGTSASSGGGITSDGGATVTACGVCWSTTANPTVINSKTSVGTNGLGEIYSSITGLLPNTIYHVRVYATNSVGTAYSSDLSFTTCSTPTITTTAASSITGTTATSGGIVSSYGGELNLTTSGVCWSITTNPTISDSKIANSTGYDTFTSSITGLLPNTTYHIRAYATNSIGTAYGSDLTFTTLNNTALNDNSIELFNVYPNPTNGTFALNMESGSENKSMVSLLNMLGQKVYESKLVSEKSTINLSIYNFKGVYFLQLHNEKGVLQGERKIVFK